MPTIKHQGLEKWLTDPDTRMPGFILAAGEDYLVQEAFDRIKTGLGSNNAGGFNLDVLDGRSTSMGDIVEQVTTFSFFGGKKIIAVKQAPVFAIKAGPGEISYSEQDLSRLSDLVEKGIPEGHFLVMTTTSLDRRRKIFKTMEKQGLVIDCTVSQGARKADLDDQRLVLQGIAKKMLSRSGKTMDQAGFSALVDRTGFNPGLFAKNLEKLVVYVKDRSTVLQTDVQAIIQRDRKDPVFSLTNALMEKNTGQAMFYLSSLLGDGFHPLQILKSFENLVRRLVLVKAFVEDFSRQHPDIRMDRMNFNTFKQKIMPGVIAHDDEMKKRMEQQQAILAPEPAPGGRKQAKKTAAAPDLLLAPNPKSPYPVFQSFDKSAGFSLKELCCALIALGDLDFALKSSSMEAKVGIENFVIIFCQKGGWLHASEN
ncbi:MAG: DNA polymerase III subunit delta [Desulfotignum sp.]|nr:DNA polymerase III subunit delta [Desulfotignum sp.]MCF8125725.1 DNA polymerase III subunit delta [Desulfotignum sp.]